MKILFQLILAGLTYGYTAGLFAQQNYSTEIIAPEKVKSGDNIPVVIRALNSLGEIAVDISGAFNLRVKNFPQSTFPVKLKKGVGSIIVNNDADSTFALSVDGFPAERTVVVETVAIQYHAGAIGSAGEIWTSDFEHRINGDLTVPEDAELIIGEGCRIILYNNANLYVYGSMRVEGRSEKPVLFTSENVSLPWGGIEIINASASFKHSFFMHGGADDGKSFGHSDSQPVLKSDQSVVTLDECYFLDNKGKALGSEKGELIVTSSLISRCDTGGEFHFSKVTISDTYVLDIPNDDGVFVDDDNDGFYFLEMYPAAEKPSVVENCYIITGKDDGIDHNGAWLNVNDCWIEGWMHEGVAASNANQITVYNTLIKECEQGIEAGYGNPLVKVDHCVVVDNDVGLRFGDSYDWGSAGQMTVTNTILYNNSENIRNYDLKIGGPVENGIVISYSITNDPAYDGASYSIAGIPQFSPEYYLNPGSPGAGSANDLLDMGRIYRDQMPSTIGEVIEKLPRNYTLYQNFPNPFNPATAIRYHLLKSSYIKLTIYNILGKAVRTLVDEIQTAGFKAVFWDGRNYAGISVSSGVYLYRLQSGKIQITRKMLLVR